MNAIYYIGLDIPQEGNRVSSARNDNNHSVVSQGMVSLPAYDWWLLQG